ncbi:ABC transporter permease [bacterium]|nr:ABC transporter permease [bacterium]
MRKTNIFFLRFFNNVSGPFIALIEETGAIFIFFGKLIKSTVYLLSHPRVLRRFYYQPIIEQLVRMGVDSIPVVITTALFTGMVLAVQTGVTIEAKMKGAAMFIGSIVNLSLTRELGPVLTAILVTGRVGSAMAAEIGSMKITEQIDALRTLAANPIEYIGVPRFLAMMIMLPILTIMANVFGSLGGWVVATFYLGISSHVYWQGARATVEFGDVASGIVKSFFFAVIICLFALYRGFTTHGGAAGVGRSTTGAVVNASITILISDYFLTQLFAIF